MLSNNINVIRVRYVWASPLIPVNTCYSCFFWLKWLFSLRFWAFLDEINLFLTQTSPQRGRKNIASKLNMKILLNWYFWNLVTNYLFNTLISPDIGVPRQEAETNTYHLITDNTPSYPLENIVRKEGKAAKATLMSTTLSSSPSYSVEKDLEKCTRRHRNALHHCCLITIMGIQISLYFRGRRYEWIVYYDLDLDH